MLDVLVFPCTYKCDGKCMMCSIHEKRISDLSVQELVPFLRIVMSILFVQLILRGESRLLEMILENLLK